eukprot:gnl/TRDRNA2_/TRDRNA2_162674_c0_seq7.p1 gnl/TRDRNA2_/TRDRNA2_162674_c0~~gnl/TRDRNA2_/TRDRNA2_162674_c0_seq7.p1  ORF type:complete len:143 (-),score=3.85 gnl/TRDRNA2_/TRDRNA2_162674_c0_seq7:22-450(-)
MIQKNILLGRSPLVRILPPVMALFAKLLPASKYVFVMFHLFCLLMILRHRGGSRRTPTLLIFLPCFNTSLIFCQFSFIFRVAVMERPAPPLMPLRFTQLSCVFGLEDLSSPQVPVSAPSRQVLRPIRRRACRPDTLPHLPTL